MLNYNKIFKQFDEVNGNVTINLNNSLHQFVDFLRNDSEHYSQSIEEAKIEIQKVKNFLSGFENFSENEEYSTKTQLIEEITKKVKNEDNSTNKDFDNRELNTIDVEQNYSNDYNNDNDLVEDAIKIKNVFDYIIAVDNEIERNKLRQK